MSFDREESEVLFFQRINNTHKVTQLEWGRVEHSSVSKRPVFSLQRLFSASTTGSCLQPCSALTLPRAPSLACSVLDHIVWPNCHIFITVCLLYYSVVCGSGVLCQDFLYSWYDPFFLLLTTFSTYPGTLLHKFKVNDSWSPFKLFAFFSRSSKWSVVTNLWTKHGR